MDHATLILTQERDACAARLANMEAAVRQERAKFRSLEDALIRLGVSIEPANKTNSARLFNGLTLKDMVLTILDEAGRGLKTSDIKENLDSQGRVTDANSVMSTLSRLKTDGAAVKGTDGLWYSSIGRSVPQEVDETPVDPLAPYYDASSDSGEVL